MSRALRLCAVLMAASVTAAVVALCASIVRACWREAVG